MTNIAYQRKEFAKAARQWKVIRDICDGENTEQYLRTLNPHDTSDENRTRNQQYRHNAIFYAIAGYTARGLVGTVFQRWPSFDPPEALSYLTANADGSGNSIYQLSQETVDELVKTGRAGLVVSFPRTDGDISRADMGTAFSTIHHIAPEQIINWRTITEGAVTKLSLVVIQSVEERPKGYENEEFYAIREMALDEQGYYFERHWEQSPGSSTWELVDEFYPTDAAGSRWREIPFTFVGSTNNLPSIDLPPMLDLVRINIGHYRNSADWEDSVFYCGQPQPWMSGMDEAHADLLSSNNFYIGSRVLLPVPAGQTFAFASADPNPVVRQAMLDKVDQMIGLGARFIEAGGSARTATEAANDAQVQHSVLSLIASNASEAYTRALEWVGRYMGVTEPMTYELAQDFSHVGSTPQEMQQVVASWLQGAIPTADMWSWMRRNGFIDPEKSDEDLEAEIDRTSDLDPQII